MLGKNLNHDVDKVTTLLEIASRGASAYLRGDRKAFDLAIRYFAKVAEEASSSLAIRELDKEQLPLNYGRRE